jgi:anti-sigma B factor antagonist
LLREELHKYLNEGERHLSLDFKECEFIDSTGLGVLVAVYKRCMELGGTMKLYSLKPQVLKLFNLTRLDKVFEIYP